MVLTSLALKEPNAVQMPKRCKLERYSLELDLNFIKRTDTQSWTNPTFFDLWWLDLLWQGYHENLVLWFLQMHSSISRYCDPLICFVEQHTRLSGRRPWLESWLLVQWQTELSHIYYHYFSLQHYPKCIHILIKTINTALYMDCTITNIFLEAGYNTP
jgi:hypothetical protein